MSNEISPVVPPPPHVPPAEELSAEEVQRRYDAAMDSVNLLNAGKPERMSDEDWQSCVQRNKDHLRQIIPSPWWNGQDLEPLKKAAE